jgi:hypothetical protein
LTKITITRINYAPTYTLGFIRYKDFFCFTLEPAKTVGKGCIACGVYIIVWEYSPKFKRYLWELKYVPNFSEIKVHSGSIPADTEGCIIPGFSFNSTDNKAFISNSGLAEKAFNKLCHEEKITHIEIRDV